MAGKKLTEEALSKTRAKYAEKIEKLKAKDKAVQARFKLLDEKRRTKRMLELAKLIVRQLNGNTSKLESINSIYLAITNGEITLQYVNGQ